MSMSLRDQLLQAGLISQKQAREADRQQQRREYQPREDRKRPPRAQAPAAPPAAVPPQAATAPTATGGAPHQARAQQAQAAKLARDQALSRKQQDKARKRAVHAEVKQLLQQNVLPNAAGEEPFNFLDGAMIRRISINGAHRAGLARGELAIVRHEGRYHLVGAAVAGRIRERDAGAVIDLAPPPAAPAPAADDPYGAFAVPDDLIW